MGGWSINGGARMQSGAPFSVGNVRLVGITRQELQKEIGMRFDDGARIAYFLPKDIIDNTIRGNNVSAANANGYGSLGAPTGRYIAPASGQAASKPSRASVAAPAWCFTGRISHGSTSAR